MKVPSFARFLPLLSLLGCLLLLELSLFVAERFFHFNKFALLRQHLGENIHYAKNRSKTAPFPHYDPLLGWRNYDTLDNPPDIQERLNGDRWRSPKPFSLQKRKRRIVLVGDSFTFGWRVDDSQTVAAYLQELVGSKYEVLNLGVRGYGLDQIALNATHIAPEYQPDILIYSFIRFDLDRSCNAFDFGASKPYFTLVKDSPVKSHIELQGVPVPTIEALQRFHSQPMQRVKDTALSWMSKSRLISLGAQIFLQKDYRQCLQVLNPLIVKYVRDSIPEQTRLMVVHLDGKLPKVFKNRLKRIVPDYLSIPPIRRALAKQLGVSPERHSDGHPKAALNRIYAQAIYEKLTASRLAQSFTPINSTTTH